MKKIIAMALALCMLLGCSAALAEGTTYSVGVIQLVQHVALDAATQGFQDALTLLVEEHGDKVEFNVQNASGDAATCATIANGFASDEVDLIMANATPALQAAVAATADIPILATSITVYDVALDIPADEWQGFTGFNVSGTSDLAPLDQQAQIIKELFPDAQNIGLIYCSAEPNSLYQVTTIGKHLEELGYQTTMYPFADSNDLASVTQVACDGADVLYIPTDNTAASYVETVYNVVQPSGTPVVAGEEGICAGCGVATLTIDYYDLGYATGKMAYEVLVNGADVSTMPIEFAPIFTKKYNPVIAAELGVEIPEGYEAIVTE